MKITYMNIYEFLGFEEIADDVSEVLIIELDRITKEEEKFLKKNNVMR